MHSQSLTLLATSAGFVCAAASAFAQCTPSWTAGFGVPSLSSGDQDIECFCVYDDGAGPALYAGGSFQWINGSYAQSLAKWDGHAWVPVGDGFRQVNSPTNPAHVRAMTVWDPDGAGPQRPVLVIGGDFDNTDWGPIGSAGYVATWDGVSLQALGSGLSDWDPNTAQYGVFALSVYDDGTGEKLYAGGAFSIAGSFARDIAVYDPTSGAWLDVGGVGASDSPVAAMRVFDDGTGPKLYAAGRFSSFTNIQNSAGLARWNGTQWEGVSTTYVAADGMRDFDPDGAGPLPASLFLYADGNVYEWNGSTMTTSQVFDGSGRLTGAIGVFDPGTGPTLYFGPNTGFLGGVDGAGHLFARTPSGFSPVGDSFNDLGFGSAAYAIAMETFDFGQGPRLLIGGHYFAVGHQRIANLAAFDGTSFDGAGATNGGIHGIPYTSKVLDADGPGPGSPSLYVTGAFTEVGNTTAHNVARWDGSAWSEVGSGLPGSATGIAVFDDGTGPALFAGASDGTIQGLYKCSAGGPWTLLTQLGAGESIGDLGVYNAELYVTGTFASIAGVPAANIAKWDGTTWTALDAGINGAGRMLTNYSNASGSYLAVAGAFSQAGGLAASRVALWDGAWTSLGTPPGSSSGTGRCTAINSGPDAGLYVNSATGRGSGPIARWDGAAWTQLPNPPGTSSVSMCAGSYDDGSGPRLVTAAINFTTHPRGGWLFSWDGAAWNMLPGGVYTNGAGGYPDTVSTFDDGAGPALYVTGRFAGIAGNIISPHAVSATASGNIARYGCIATTPACNADYNQDGSADTSDVLDLANDIASGLESFPPSSPDFNQDGSADTGDVLDLANVVAGGNCP